MNEIDLSGYKLPRYHEIPKVGLYLKQVVTFINDATEPLLHTQVTASMLSNYVKAHMVASPVKKAYDREQIATLIFIVLAKNVLSLDNIGRTLDLQRRTTDSAVAYDFFCNKFECMLAQVSGKDVVVFPEKGLSAEAHLLKCIITTLAQKIFLDECFIRFQMEEEASAEG